MPRPSTAQDGGAPLSRPLAGSPDVDEPTYVSCASPAGRPQADGAWPFLTWASVAGATAPISISQAPGRFTRTVIELQPMPDDAIARALARSAKSFVMELVLTGVDLSEARRRADETVQNAFPGGFPAPGHLLFEIVEDGLHVGHVWLGPAPDKRPNRWWVWHIEVIEQARGRGVGRRAMELAEEEVRRRGGKELGLNVFARNTAARRLYESLDFEVTSLLMRKIL